MCARLDDGLPVGFRIVAASTPFERRVDRHALGDPADVESGTEREQDPAAVRIEPLEANAFDAQMESKKFDAMLNAWHIDPDPASFRDEWSSVEMKRGGFNYSSYDSPAFDAIADSAAAERNLERSKELYRRAYLLLANDAPAMWLYELKNAFGISNRIQPAGLRPDAWWANLADWKIRPVK
jgi:peptide/nickel transport system substrate-binding protein